MIDRLPRVSSAGEQGRATSTASCTGKSSSAQFALTQDCTSATRESDGDGYMYAHPMTRSPSPRTVYVKPTRR